MRRLMKKFKEWLIVKLGGYTSPMLAFNVYKPKPIALHAIMRGVRSRYISDNEIKDQLSHMIASEITNKGLYKIERSSDFETNEAMYRMSVIVVDPSDL